MKLAAFLAVLPLLGGLGAAATPFPAEHAGLLDDASNSTEHVHVHSGYELAQALQAGATQIAVAERYILLSDDCFANMTTLPIAINQNTTIFGAPELPEVIVQISARGQVCVIHTSQPEPAAPLTACSHDCR